MTKNKQSLAGKASNKGQVLVILIVFMAIMSAVTVMAVNLMITNSSSARKFEQGVNLLQIAESGVELSLIKLLRDPLNYTGETFTIDGASVTVNITGGVTKTLVSTGVLDGFTRKVEVLLSDPIDDTMVITSWKEIYW